MKRHTVVRHALVTGGGQGIGAAIARLLVACGARVTVLGRRLEVMQALAEQAPEQIHAVAADVADAQQVGRALASAQARFGVVQVLVNNAGQAESMPFQKMDIALWQRMLNVNLTGSMVCAQAVLPGMLDSGWAASSTWLALPV